MSDPLEIADLVLQVFRRVGRELGSVTVLSWLAVIIATQPSGEACTDALNKHEFESGRFIDRTTGVTEVLRNPIASNSHGTVGRCTASRNSIDRFEWRASQQSPSKITQNGRVRPRTERVPLRLGRGSIVGAKTVRDAVPAVQESHREERLIKSGDRVRDLGEVFTPDSTVAAMLDMLPKDVWMPNPSRTFLEPAAGNGNFLVAILDRKLRRLDELLKSELDPSRPGIVPFLGLEAISSIYAIDISEENIVGNHEAGEQGARARLMHRLADWIRQYDSVSSRSLGAFWRSTEWILERNIMVGNMLPFHADGSPSGYEQIQLLEYTWNHKTMVLTVDSFRLGDTLESSSGSQIGLFANEPKPEPWKGKPSKLPSSGIPLPTSNMLHAHNGHRVRDEF